MLESNLKNQSAQSLLELIIVLAIAIIVIGALAIVTITSLRNANLSKNQLQATKYAQEGMERVRSIRNRDGRVVFDDGSGTPTEKFSDLWRVKMRHECGGSCNSKLDSFINNLDSLVQTSTGFESLEGGFERSVQITDRNPDYDVNKTVTVLVSWVDFAGKHQSKLITNLGKI